MLNLVEGQEATILSENNEFPPFTVHYAETFIVPASVNKYKIRPAEGISNTIFPAPEQWIVPAGIEMWSCFLTGSFIVPASVNKYKIRPAEGIEKVILIVARVK